MHKNKKSIINIKATIIDIIVALIIFIIISAVTYLCINKKLNMAISLVNKISIDTTNKKVEPIQMDHINQKLKNYPEYGTKYATIKIDSAGIELPLYYGDSLSLLRNGAGQSSGGYFPGEGGSILCMAHNSKGMFRTLPQVKKGDKIKITTSYGEFTYTVYNTKVVKDTALEELPIQKEEEKLMVYTCYPVDTIGHKSHRFVVYANKD